MPRTFGAAQLNGLIATGDFNGDNHSDVVVTTETGFSVLLGNGDGSFEPPSHVDSTQSFGSIAVGDLDGNGLLGVITGTYGSIFVYVSNGDGTFQSPVTFSRPNNGPIAPGDFDGDHRIDIVSASESFPGSLSVFLGNGDGTFQSPTTTALSFEPTALAVGDFNGDHRDDVAVAPYPDCCPPVGLVDVLLGDGTGGFSEPLEYA
ncbi:MAG TPA: VCBS repeat-containing protein, partial [Thermoanaerobaculia bacterium]|nr:VCBS repeat-containing protein [Thermoanaerobaculia bacterium]